ncbi:hypothetical protein PENSPDRAFT_737813 [Peniophora sp. CONT]|nr:hypothetical protein PENSPDRAFT_737813 [Peniophora sp. CONT]
MRLRGLVFSPSRTSHQQSLAFPVWRLHYTYIPVRLDDVSAAHNDEGSASGSVSVAGFSHAPFVPLCTLTVGLQKQRGQGIQEVSRLCVTRRPKTHKMVRSVYSLDLHSHRHPTPSAHCPAHSRDWLLPSPALYHLSRYQKTLIMSNSHGSHQSSRLYDQHDPFLGRLLLTPEQGPHDNVYYDNSNFASTSRAGPANVEAEAIEYESHPWQERAAAQPEQGGLRTPARAHPETTLPTPQSLRHPLLDFETSPAPPRHRRRQRSSRSPPVYAEAGSSAQALPVNHFSVHYPRPVYGYPLPHGAHVSQHHLPGPWNGGVAYDPTQRLESDYRLMSPSDDTPRDYEEPNIQPLSERNWHPEEDAQVGRWGEWTFEEGERDFDENGREVERPVGPHDEVVELDEEPEDGPIVTLGPQHPLPGVSSFYALNSRPVSPPTDFDPFAAFATSLPPPGMLFEMSLSASVPFRPLVVPTASSSNRSDANNARGDDEVWRKDGKRKRVAAEQRDGSPEAERPAKRARQTTPTPSTPDAPAPRITRSRKDKKGKGRAQPRRAHARTPQPSGLRREYIFEDEPAVGMSASTSVPSVDPPVAPTPVRLKRNLRPAKAGLSYAGMC